MFILTLSLVSSHQEVAYKMNFPLSKSERDDLCNLFDLHSNGWFHYMSFLQAVKKQSPAASVNPCVYDIHTKRLHGKVCS